MYAQDEYEDADEIERDGRYEDDRNMRLCLQCINCPVNSQRILNPDGCWWCFFLKKWRWASDVWEYRCPGFKQKTCDNCTSKPFCKTRKIAKVKRRTALKCKHTFCVKGYRNRGIRNVYHWMRGLARDMRDLEVDGLTQNRQLEYEDFESEFRQKLEEKLYEEYGICKDDLPEHGILGGEVSETHMQGVQDVVQPADEGDILREDSDAGEYGDWT